MNNIIETIYNTLINKGYEDFGEIRFDVYPGDLKVMGENVTAVFVDDSSLGVNTEEEFYDGDVLSTEDFNNILYYVENMTEVKSGVYRDDEDETIDEQEFMCANSLGLAVVDGVQVFYTDWHFSGQVPEGYYKYEIRTSDNSYRWSTLEDSVNVNLGGAIISKTEFPLTNGYYDIKKYVILFEGD